MPLIQSASKPAIGKNIAKETDAGKPKRQAVAIALNTARKAGGNLPPPKRRAFQPPAAPAPALPNPFAPQTP